MRWYDVAGRAGERAGTASDCTMACLTYSGATVVASSRRSAAATHQPGRWCRSAGAAASAAVRSANSAKQVAPLPDMRAMSAPGSAANASNTSRIPGEPSELWFALLGVEAFRADCGGSYGAVFRDVPRRVQEVALEVRPGGRYYFRA